MDLNGNYSSFMLVSHAHNPSSTCGPGCRCVRQMELFDSLEADFRATGVETKNEWADDLMVKRVELGFGYVRIDRAGRCLAVWADALRAEMSWQQAYERAIEQGKRVAEEQKEAERQEREAAELRRAAVEEAEKERKKARFMGSFGKLQWE